MLWTLQAHSHTAAHRTQASLNPPDTAIHPPAWEDPERLADDAELSPNGRHAL